jgi:hypothetical protein
MRGSEAKAGCTERLGVGKYARSYALVMGQVLEPNLPKWYIFLTPTDPATT